MTSILRLGVLAIPLLQMACAGTPPPPEPIILDSRYASEASTPDVIALLANDQSHIRKMAAAELGYNRRDYEAIPALIHALDRETDPDVALRLATVLLIFRDQRAIDAVVRLWLVERYPAYQSELLSGLYGADPCLVETAMAAHGHLSPEKAPPVRQACPMPRAE